MSRQCGICVQPVKVSKFYKSGGRCMVSLDDK